MVVFLPGAFNTVSASAIRTVKPSSTCEKCGVCETGLSRCCPRMSPNLTTHRLYQLHGEHAVEALLGWRNLGLETARSRTYISSWSQGMAARGCAATSKQRSSHSRPWGECARPWPWLRHYESLNSRDQHLGQKTVTSCGACTSNDQKTPRLGTRRRDAPVRHRGDEPGPDRATRRQADEAGTENQRRSLHAAA